MEDKIMSKPELIKTSIEILLKPVENTIKTLFGPAAEEFGLSLRDSIRTWRIKNQIRLFQKFETTCAEAGIRPKAVKPLLLFEILDGASLEDDENLQETWTNLLLNAADSRQDVLVETAFPQILRQLSSKEVRYLSDLSNIVKHETKPYLDSVSYDNLRRLRLIDANAHLMEEFAGFSRTYKQLTPDAYFLTALGEAFIRACTAPSNGRAGSVSKSK